MVSRPTAIALVFLFAAAGAGVAGIVWRRAEIASEAAGLRPGLDAADVGARLEAAEAITRLRARWLAPELADLRPLVVKRLADTIVDGDVETRARAAEALAAWGPDATDAIVELLGSDDDQVRIHAAWACSLAPGPATIPTLRDRVKDGRPEVRSYALDALGRMPMPRLDEEAIADMIFRAWKDPVPLVQNAAAEALVRQGVITGLPILAKNVKDPLARFWVRYDAYRRLRGCFARANKSLPDYVASAPVPTRSKQADAVLEAVFSDRDLQRGIVDQLQVFKNQIMTATKWTVFFMGRHIVPELVARIRAEESNGTVRKHAAELLADLSDPALARPDFYRNARPTVEQIALPALRDELTRRAEQPRAAWPPNESNVLLDVMRALGHLGDASDVARLTPWMSSPDADLSIRAITAVARIGERLDGPAAIDALRALDATGERATERDAAITRLTR